MSTQEIGQPSNVTPPSTQAITSSTNTAPIVLDVPGHGYLTGQWVQVNGHVTNTAANGRWPVVVVDSAHFQLDGSTGVGVGGATGTVQALDFGATFAIPADGDDLDAASVNVAFDALADWTSFLAAQVGPYKFLSRFEAHVNDDGTENTDWLGAPFTFSAANAWTKVTTFAVAATADGILEAGDIIDVDFSFSVQWTDSGTTTEGLLLGLGVGFSVTGVSPGSFSKIDGSGQVVPVAQINTTRTGMRLQGSVTVPANVQTAYFFLYGYTRNATPGDVSFTAPGDYKFNGTVWRPTSFVGRVG